MAKFATVLLVVLFTACTLGAPSSKIHPAVQASLKSNNNVDILINFQGGSNEVPLRALSAKSFPARASRGMAVKETLQSWANTYQSEVLQFLEARSSQVEQFVQLWVSNQVYVRGASAELIAAIAEFSKVTEIKEDERIPLIDYTFEGAKSPKEEGIFAEWGIENIRAPQVWALSNGSTGVGVLVSTIDTGVRYTHESLRDNYIGTANGGWLDPYTNSMNPIDLIGHGTHTTGTIAGSNGIGVAPGARWSSCRGCNTITCAQSALARCAQWTVCPTSSCANIPDVSSNSWGGSGGQHWFDQSINAMKAAGVIVVFANGNDGEFGCNTAHSPADNAGVIAVGAIDSANNLASFSSRGPSAFRTIKPDISAPGVLVRSAVSESDNAYAAHNGTSMACPHVAGVVALLLGKDPNLTYEEIFQLLTRNASTDVIPTGESCGGINDSVFPNNAYGYGRVDALASFQALLATY